MYFAIRRSDDGQYWWRAVGDNNEIMAASDLMTSKQSCEHSIGVIQDLLNRSWPGPGALVRRRGRLAFGSLRL